MAGVDHIYLYDNNHVEKGQDLDIRPTIQPFIEAGFVTHVPWSFSVQKNDNTGESTLEITKEEMSTDLKDKFMTHCLLNYNDTAKWMLRLDTDEHVLVVPPTYELLGEDIELPNDSDGFNSSAPALKSETKQFYTPLHHSKDLNERGYVYDPYPLLEYSSRLPSDVGSVKMHWIMMYPNHTILRQQNKPLLDAFPRVCIPYHRYPKPLFIANSVAEITDHWVKRFNRDLKTIDSPIPGLRKDRKGKMIARHPLAGLHTVHYYAKSLQEFIIKKEQSYTWLPRLLDNMHDTKGKKISCDKRMLIYPPGYTETLRLVMDSIKSLPDGGLPVGKLAGTKPIKYGDHSDYALYLFFKWIISERFEWDEEAYFDIHPSLPSIINASLHTNWPYIDGLHHFMRTGFYQKNSSCWQRTDPSTGQIIPKSSVCF
jgi:hypothetical protein